jgi:hypothetical protein
VCSHRATSLQLTVSAVPRPVGVCTRATARKTNMETSNDLEPFYNSDHDGLGIGQLLVVPSSLRTEELWVAERRHQIGCRSGLNVPVRPSGFRESYSASFEQLSKSRPIHKYVMEF